MALDSKRLLAEVRENLSKLNDCADHDFKPVRDDRPVIMARKYQCARCEGVVDSHAWFWYEKGRKHEQASPSKSPLGDPV